MTNGSHEQERGQVLLYQTDEGGLRLECRLEEETLWLTLNQMAELFGRDKSVISKHLKTIYEDGELVREATVAKYATVQTLICELAESATTQDYLVVQPLGGF